MDQPTHAQCGANNHAALQEQVGGLLADLSALMAPGSRLLFDFLHAPETASSGGGGGGGASEPPGFATLAAAVANKGCPLRSGLKPSFSGALQGQLGGPAYRHVSALLL